MGKHFVHEFCDSVSTNVRKFTETVSKSPLNFPYHAERSRKAAARRAFVRGGAVGAALCAAVVAGRALWSAWRRRPKQADVDAWRQANGLDELTASGEAYKPDERDCLAGETADKVVYDYPTEESGVECDVADEDAPPGLRRRGGAVRRIARRVKMVHTPYQAGGSTADPGFLGDVIAEARTQGFAGHASLDNISRARIYMSRLMKERGMRPAHIDANLSRMVLAVFEKRDYEVAHEEAMQRGRQLGRIKDAPTVK